MLKSCRAVACCRRYIQHEFNKPAGDKPPPYDKRSTDSFVRTPFHTPCHARYGVLHILGVLSGDNIAFLREEGGSRRLTEGARVTLDLH